MQATIRSYVPRGLRHEGGRWLAYRRNYFVVMASVVIDLPLSVLPIPRVSPTSFPAGNSTHAFYTVVELRDGGTRTVRVKSFAVAIQAEDEISGKPVELVQHTPKRDAGPQRTPVIVAVAPTFSDGRVQQQQQQQQHENSLSLSYQQPPEDDFGQLEGQDEFAAASSESYTSGGSSIGSEAPSSDKGGDRVPETVIFERIQFKKATANNGRKNTAQQMFRLVTVLYAAVDSQECADIVGSGVFACRSGVTYIELQRVGTTGIVVRGRSPGHYAERSQGMI